MKQQDPEVTAESTAASDHGIYWPAVPWPVLMVAAIMFVALMAVSGAYGFHGDRDGIRRDPDIAHHA